MSPGIRRRKPSSYSGRIALGLILVALFLLAAAPAAADQDLEIRTRAARLRVQAHLAREEWAAAEEQLRSLVGLFPDDRYLLGDLAAAYQRQGKVDLAIAAYRRLLELHPAERVYRQDLFYLLAAAGRHAELVALFDQSSEPPDRELLPLVAEALDRTGQTGRADHLYAAALEQYPQDAELLLTAGQRWLDRGDPPQALPYLQRAYAIQPREPRLLKALARAVQDSDPEQYRQYLLPVLVLDKEDAEAPFLIGELYRTAAPQRAARYYREALKRLEKKEHPEFYQQLLKARLLDRLGDSRQAESRLRDLLAQHPEAIEPRLDLAQLLVDRGRFAEVLDLLPADSTDVRAAWLRLAVYQQRADWPAAAAELAFLTARQPDNWNLRLDLADALERSGRWPEALRLCDELLSAPPSRAAAERALELRRDLRLRRGTAIAVEGTYTSLPGESSRGAHPTLRWQFAPRLAGSFHWTSGLYQDGPLPTRPAFSERVQELAVELVHAWRPDWEIGLQGRGYLGHLETHPGLGLRARHRLRGSGALELEVRANDLWTEPVDAVFHQGRFHRAALSLSTPLFARLYLQAQASGRSFRVRDDRYFGREGRASLFLGREILRLPYGASFPLRSLNLSLAIEEARTSQQAALADLLQLQARIRILALNLFAHAVLARRALLDLSLYAGLDPQRDLDPGELYGLAVESHLALTPALALDAGGSFASDSSVQAVGGAYRQARVGIIYYFTGYRASH